MTLTDVRPKPRSRKLLTYEEYVAMPVTMQRYEILELREDRYVRQALFGAGDTARSALLPGLEFEVDAIFE